MCSNLVKQLLLGEAIHTAIDSILAQTVESQAAKESVMGLSN